MKGRIRIINALVALAAAAALSASAAAEWRLDWSTIDAGGEIEADGGSWSLSGTVGQWDATADDALTGGHWELTGGFWQSEMPEAEDTDRIFSDRFES